MSQRSGYHHRQKRATNEPTPRELDVLRLLAAGLTYKQIGTRLNISWRTVQTHAARLRGKFGVSSQTQLIVLALNRGLIPPA